MSESNTCNESNTCDNVCKVDVTDKEFEERQQLGMTFINETFLRKTLVFVEIASRCCLEYKKTDGSANNFLLFVFMKDGVYHVMKSDVYYNEKLQEDKIKMKLAYVHKHILDEDDPVYYKRTFTFNADDLISSIEITNEDDMKLSTWILKFV